MDGEMTFYPVRSELSRPYHLAIGTVDEFDSIITVINDENRIVWGEATPLPGYSWETSGSIQETVNRCFEESGNNWDGLKKHAEALMSRSPFAATSILSAVEKFLNIPLFEEFKNVEVPLAGIVSAETDDESAKAVKGLMESGYKTLKVKLLGDIESDIDRIKKIQGSIDQDIKLRLDANQSYDIERVKRLFKEINLESIELLEQPFERDAWQSVRSLSQWGPVPVMLDESIWSSSDIKKAAEAGAKFVKLKLMKHGGILNTVNLAKEAQRLGLEVILGNGVQTDLGCIDECYIYMKAGLKYAGEMNGFLKMNEPLLSSGICAREGRAMVDLKRVLTETKNINLRKHGLSKIHVFRNVRVKI